MRGQKAPNQVIIAFSPHPGGEHTGINPWEGSFRRKEATTAHPPARNGSRKQSKCQWTHKSTAVPVIPAVASAGNIQHHCFPSHFPEQEGKALEKHSRGKPKETNDVYQDGRTAPMLRPELHQCSRARNEAKVIKKRSTDSKCQLQTPSLGLQRCQSPHLLPPGRLEGLEGLHVAAVEGEEGVDEPLPVRAAQGLQHGVHQLQGTGRRV